MRAGGVAGGWAAPDVEHVAVPQVPAGGVEWGREAQGLIEDRVQARECAVLAPKHADKTCSRRWVAGRRQGAGRTLAAGDEADEAAEADEAEEPEEAAAEEVAEAAEAKGGQRQQRQRQQRQRRSPRVVVQVEGAEVAGGHTLKHRTAAVHVQPACGREVGGSSGGVVGCCRAAAAAAAHE